MAHLLVIEVLRLLLGECCGIVQIDSAKMQVWRWAGQYKASLLDGEAPLSEMLRLGDWLAAHIPLNDSDPAVTRVSHGDFRSASHGRLHS